MFFTELFFLLLTASVVSPTRADLYLNDWDLLAVKSELLIGTLSLLKYHNFPDVFEYLSVYLIKLQKGIAM